jgi:hypothetical protein
MFNNYKNYNELCQSTRTCSRSQAQQPIDQETNKSKLLSITFQAADPNNDENISYGPSEKLNFFPAKQGISKYYSPRMIIHQNILTTRKTGSSHLELTSKLMINQLQHSNT